MEKLTKQELIEKIKGNLDRYKIAYIEDGGSELGDGTWCTEVEVIESPSLSAEKDIKLLIDEVERLTAIVEAMPNQPKNSTLSKL